MKRFTHLEFEDASDQPGPLKHGEAIRGTGYFYQRGTQSFLHGDYEQALRNYSRSLEVNSMFFPGWIGQLRMLIELTEYPETLLWADKALELFPEHPEFLAVKAVACLRDAKIEEARAFSDNSITKDKVGPRVWLARAEVLLEGKSRIAEDCLSKAIALGGDEGDLIRLETGRLLRRYQRYSTAIGHLQEAVRVFPKSAVAWYELGLCQSRLGLPQGKTSLEQCLNLRPHWKAAQDALGRAQSSGLLRRLFWQLRLR